MFPYPPLRNLLVGQRGSVGSGVGGLNDRGVGSVVDGRSGVVSGSRVVDGGGSVVGGSRVVDGRGSIMGSCEAGQRLER